MAHSGGGGSFDGDFYSGGDFDYGDSSYDHEFYYPSTARGQKQYRPGANRYVYYYRKKSHIYYSDSPLTEKDYRRDGVAILVISFIFTVICLWLAVAVIMETSHSGKLEQNYNAQICIEDDARLLEDKQKLKEELEEFQKETGISVAVETRRYCHATSMREYAMDEYYRHFTDESHWLICYVGTEKDRTDEWAWELVCGDDCIQVLDYDQEDQFTQAFQNGLYNTKDSLDEVLMNSLHSLEPRLEWHIYGDGKSSVIFWLCMMIPSVYGMIYGALKLWGPIPPRHVAKMKAKATASPQGELEYKQCPNCGGYKVKGTTSKCPYCGSGYYVQ